MIFSFQQNEGAHIKEDLHPDQGQGGGVGEAGVGG